MFIRSNTQSWNYEFWFFFADEFVLFFRLVFLHLVVYFDSQTKKSSFYQIKINSGFWKTKFKIRRFRIGCLAWSDEQVKSHETNLVLLLCNKFKLNNTSMQKLYFQFFRDYLKSVLNFRKLLISAIKIECNMILSGAN